jgi:hypothetical protein
MPHKSCESLYVNDVGAVTTEIMIAHVILQDPDGSPSVFARVDRYSHITPPGPIHVGSFNAKMAVSPELERLFRNKKVRLYCAVCKNFIYT